jgi:hypothetical protein
MVSCIPHTWIAPHHLSCLCRATVFNNFPTLVLTWPWQDSVPRGVIEVGCSYFALNNCCVMAHPEGVMAHPEAPEAPTLRMTDSNRTRSRSSTGATLQVEFVPV